MNRDLVNDTGQLFYETKIDIVRIISWPDLSYISHKFEYPNLC